MYQSLLTKRYLTSKVMPLLAAAAVMLCTAMVLIVWSVMGGFLNKLLESGRTMVGDVFIEWPNSGFAYYDELLADLRKDGRVAGATPLIETFGVVSLPDDRIEGVNIRCIDPVSFATVVDYPSMLWWKPIEQPLPKDKLREDPRLASGSRKDLMEGVYQDGLRLAELNPATGKLAPAAVLGIEMTSFSKRQEGGFYLPRMLMRPRPDGKLEAVGRWMPDASITIRVLPMDKGGRDIQLSSRPLPVANEFRTGIYENDRKTMFIPLDLGQELLKMNAAQTTAPGFDPYDIDPTSGGPKLKPPTVTGVDPARVTTILVKAKPGTTADELRLVCDGLWEKFAARHKDVPSITDMRESQLIKTWEMRQATFIGAVKKETSLILLILCFISLTASFMILAIFWAMISEKTKDIGILRALGASRTGIAWVWLRYGIVIGVVGSVSGFGLALLIVTNINAIHEWLGSALGLYIWDPKVYYFAEIPSKVEPSKAAIVLTGGILFSLFGALIPAIRAASLDPVKALRFE